MTADELSEYVHTQVREATNGQQNPTSDRTNFDPDMFLAYVPANAAPATAPAPKFGSLVFESNMDDVEVFVDSKSIGTVSKGKPLSLPGLNPANIRSRASIWAMSRMGRDKRWSIPARNPLSRSRS